MSPSLLYIPIPLLLLLVSARVEAAAAVCSLCAAMIVSGLGLARFLGAGSCILAIWLGALLLWLCQMNAKLLEKLKIRNTYSVTIGSVATYCLILPLYAGDKPLLRFNGRTILGIDDFLFFLFLGTSVLFLSLRIYQLMKEKNGKPHFPFEKVVLPLVSLTLCSLLVNYLMG
ncbi:MAG: hypothetical protein LBU15_03455 [Rickettsiales bacterium]|jgi:hypothetical protein|nr:hypothetical protein [Rickettsiales bacterium]